MSVNRRTKKNRDQNDGQRLDAPSPETYHDEEKEVASVVGTRSRRMASTLLILHVCERNLVVVVVVGSSMFQPGGR